MPGRSETAFSTIWFLKGSFMSKKIIAVVLLMVLLISNLVSCGDKNDGFEEVASVTYTVDGTKKTENSVARMSLGPAEYVSENEYNRAKSRYKIFSVEISTNLTASSKTVSSIGSINNSDKGKYVYYRYVDWGSVEFLKYEITSEIYYDYIKVKVVDDDTIIIKNSSGTTTYNVSSYSITYFN